MTPATPEGELTPDLIERVRKLSPESKDKLVVLLLDELDGPPDDRTDEEIAAEIKRRSDDFHAGTAKLLTPEEVGQNVREVLRRRYGYEL
jgi:putative addiction module component (TIGR02574 family)